MDYFGRKPEKIAVFRALQIGDLLTGVPALRALRAANPGAAIHLVGLPWAREFVERFWMYLDEWIEFPGYPGLPEREPDLKALPGFFKGMQRRRIDLAIQMHGSGAVSNAIVAAFGAKHMDGFFPPCRPNPAPASFLPYPNDIPDPLRHLRLMEHLGFEPQGDHLEFPILPDEWQEFDRSACSAGYVPGQYVCIHPGSRAADRRWPADRFAQVADRLAAQGWPVAFTGSKHEVSLVETIVNDMRYPALSLAGTTTLGVAAAWISQAGLLICNDTGVSHIAAALRTPSLVLFTNSDLLRWAPLNRELHQVIPNALAASADEVVRGAESILSIHMSASTEMRVSKRPAINLQASQ